MSFTVEKTEFIRTSRIWIGNNDLSSSIQMSRDEVDTLVVDRVEERSYVQYSGDLDPTQSEYEDQPFTRTAEGMSIFTEYIHPYSPKYSSSPKLLFMRIERLNKV